MEPATAVLSFAPAVLSFAFAVLAAAPAVLSFAPAAALFAGPAVLSFAPAVLSFALTALSAGLVLCSCCPLSWLLVLLFCPCPLLLLSWPFAFAVLSAAPVVLSVGLVVLSVILAARFRRKPLHPLFERSSLQQGPWQPDFAGNPGTPSLRGAPLSKAPGNQISQETLAPTL